MDDRFIPGDVYGEFRQSTTTRFIIFFGVGGEQSLKGGQLSVFLMVYPSELEKYFPIVFDFEKLEDTLESDIFWSCYKLFNIEFEDVNELVSDQCLLAYATSSTSLTLKV